LLGPETAHSPNADDLNALYVVMVGVAAALVLAINVVLIGLALRFRARRGREPQRLKSRGIVQLGTAGVFAALAAVVFVLGVITTRDASEVEASGSEGLQASSLVTAQRSLDLPSGEGVQEPLEVEATGQQWIWRYEYPDGTFNYYELVVPVDTAMVVKLSSTDVVHRWWVPGLGGKFAAVPGQSNQTWFKVEADELGEDGEATFDGASYAFSGTAYAVMRTRVRALTVPAYEAWLEEQAAGIQEAQAFVQQQVSAGPQPGTDQAVTEEGEGQ
jgi:heme/copper-type cytochrome/quinol oxidase subunit 2